MALSASFSRTPREITKVEEHPKGGYLCYFSDGSVFLRTSFAEWFRWPKCVKPPYFAQYEKAWDEFKIRQKYAPDPLPTYSPKPTTPPNRCMFCHDALGTTLNAQCFSCGAAMHLSCADENEDACITPGCTENGKKRQRKASQKSEEQVEPEKAKGFFGRLFS